MVNFIGPNYPTVRVGLIQQAGFNLKEFMDLRSLSIRSAFVWTASDWRGLPKQAMVLYEMHLGAFTRSGDYSSAIERLDELVELGITAIELMPLAETAGSRNWGYDGVNLYAPRNSFGTPEELCRFVDTAHQAGFGGHSRCGLQPLWTRRKLLCTNSADTSHRITKQYGAMLLTLITMVRS